LCDILGTCIAAEAKNGCDPKPVNCGFCETCDDNTGLCVDDSQKCNFGNDCKFYACDNNAEACTETGWLLLLLLLLLCVVFVHDDDVDCCLFDHLIIYLSIQVCSIFIIVLFILVDLLISVFFFITNSR